MITYAIPQTVSVNRYSVQRRADERKFEERQAKTLIGPQSGQLGSEIINPGDEHAHKNEHENLTANEETEVVIPEIRAYQQNRRANDGREQDKQK